MLSQLFSFYYKLLAAVFTKIFDFGFFSSFYSVI
jgi:hypothetical protein